MAEESPRFATVSFPFWIRLIRHVVPSAYCESLAILRNSLSIWLYTIEGVTILMKRESTYLIWLHYRCLFQFFRCLVTFWIRLICSNQLLYHLDVHQILQTMHFVNFPRNSLQPKTIELINMVVENGSLRTKELRYMLLTYSVLLSFSEIASFHWYSKSICVYCCVGHTLHLYLSLQHCWISTTQCCICVFRKFQLFFREVNL